jgi:hypothetical protein
MAPKSLPALSASERKHITNNYARYVQHPAEKRDYIRSLDEKKRPAAEKLWAELRDTQHTPLVQASVPASALEPVVVAPAPVTAPITTPGPANTPSLSTVDASTISAALGRLSTTTLPAPLAASTSSLAPITTTNVPGPTGSPAQVPNPSDHQGPTAANVAVVPAVNVAAQTSGTAMIPTANLLDAPAFDFTEATIPTNPPPANAYSVGRPVTVDAGLAAKLSNFTGTLNYPARAGLRSGKYQGRVLTNHFKIAIKPNTTFYEYQILGIPASESRPGKKRYMHTAIRHVPFLNDKQDSFATDYVDTIISWINLHQFVTGPRLQNGHPTTEVGAEWGLIDITDGSIDSSLRLHYLRNVDITGLQSYVKTSHIDPANFDPNPAENALNIIMKKCITTNKTLYLNDHKFYVRDAFYDLTYRGFAPLRALRGYSYKVKPNMGDMLLNVSPAMSAFWRPWLVSDLIQNNNQGLRAFNEGSRALKNVKVYITYDRGLTKDSQAFGINNTQARIKTIRGFGEACSVQTFQFDRKNNQGQVIQTQNLTVEAYQLQGMSFSGHNNCSANQFRIPTNTVFPGPTCGQRRDSDTAYMVRSRRSSHYSGPDLCKDHPG